MGTHVELSCYWWENFLYPRNKLKFLYRSLCLVFSQPGQVQSITVLAVKWIYLSSNLIFLIFSGRIFLNTHVDDQKIRWRSQTFFNDWLGQSAEVVHDLFYLFIYFIYLLVALKLKIELYIYFGGDKDWRYTYVPTLPIWSGNSRFSNVISAR